MPDSREVAPSLKETFAAWVDARTLKGVLTYGERLKTHNGRDARLDAMEEIVDFTQYLMQSLMEAEDEIHNLRKQLADIRQEDWRADY